MGDNQLLNQDDIDKLMSDDGGLDGGWDEASLDPGKPAAPPAPHSFEPLRTPEKPAPTGMGDRSLDFILDIPLEVSVELGRTRMVINDLLQLGQGSVIELTKLAGEPLEILVNNKLVARGEVVVVNEKFGVRVTDIVSPMERVKSLG
ncbi:MAG: flagellar motor switch protein FliN [Thermodesulfobacteriota bacterium]